MSAAAQLGRGSHAAVLAGAAQALRDQAGIPQSPIERSHYEQYLDVARAQVDEDTWSAAFAAGRRMSVEQAVEYALEES